MLSTLLILAPLLAAPASELKLGSDGMVELRTPTHLFRLNTVGGALLSFEASSSEPGPSASSTQASLPDGMVRLADGSLQRLSADGRELCRSPALPRGSRSSVLASADGRWAGLLQADTGFFLMDPASCAIRSWLPGVAGTASLLGDLLVVDRGGLRVAAWSLPDLWPAWTSHPLVNTMEIFLSPTGPRLAAEQRLLNPWSGQATPIPHDAFKAGPYIAVIERGELVLRDVEGVIRARAPAPGWRKITRIERIGSWHAITDGARIARLDPDGKLDLWVAPGAVGDLSMDRNGVVSVRVGKQWLRPEGSPSEPPLALVYGTESGPMALRRVARGAQVVNLDTGLDLGALLPRIPQRARISDDGALALLWTDTSVEAWSVARGELLWTRPSSEVPHGILQGPLLQGEIHGEDLVLRADTGQVLFSARPNADATGLTVTSGDETWDWNRLSSGPPLKKPWSVAPLDLPRPEPVGPAVDLVLGALGFTTGAPGGVWPGWTCDQIESRLEGYRDLPSLRALLARRASAWCGPFGRLPASFSPSEPLPAPPPLSFTAIEASALPSPRPLLPGQAVQGLDASGVLYTKDDTITRLPLRPDRPTLVTTTVRAPDLPRPPYAADLLWLYPESGEMGKGPAWRKEIPWSKPGGPILVEEGAGPTSSRAARALGLGPSEAMLVSGQGMVLARGSLAEVVRAGRRLGLETVDRPLPKKVHQKGWIRGVEGSEHALDTLTVATDRLLQSRKEGVELRRLADDALLWRTGDWTRIGGVVRETALVSRGKSWTMIRLADASVVWTREDLGEEVRIVSGEVIAQVKGLRCAFRVEDGAQLGCAPPVESPPIMSLRQGEVHLSVESGGILVARNEKGRELWRLHGVSSRDLHRLDERRAVVRLGNDDGHLAVVDHRGRIRAWLPPEIVSLSQGDGVLLAREPGRIIGVLP